MAARYFTPPSLTGLKSTFHYNRETGQFTFLKTDDKCGKQKIGDVAGCQKTCWYNMLRYEGRYYYAHRIAWYMVHGNLPNLHIDHINGVKSDNRIQNLRLIEPAHNIQNQVRPHKDNLAGYLGVSEHGKNRFRATIQLGKKRTHIGIFDTPEDAYAAYVDAKRKIHAGCTI